MFEHEYNMEHEVINFEKAKAWAEQSKAAKRIDDVGVERYFASLDDETKRELFHRTDTRVGCMDEGCADCGFRIAGSGILIEPEDQAAFLENCRRLGVTEFTHHEGCGAAGVYKKKMGSEKDAAELAKEFSDHAAGEYGASDSYIPASEMIRPIEFHSTRFAYYDGTGRLNLSAAAGKLPNGFVMTRGLYPKEKYAIGEAELAFQIAAGHHGFGELITEQEPFEIIVVGDPDNQEMSLEALMKELEPLRANPKIKITGFEAPSAQEQQLAQAA